MNNHTQIILGIDPGLADTGFGVISKNTNELIFVNAGSIKTKKGLDFSKRLEIIYNEIDKLIKKHKPDIIGIEKLYFARNVTTAIDVAQARGVALLACQQNKKVIVEFTPLQVKQAVSASGSAGKNQVGLMVKTILKLKAVPKPDDAADALAVAITASFFNSRLV